MSNANPTAPAATRPKALLLTDPMAAVGHGARRDLECYVALLSEWQRVHNLVSHSALVEVWTRHVADSLQLLEYAPLEFREWVDLGSGAGFPGLVVAIACKPEAGFEAVPQPPSEGARAAGRRGGRPSIDPRMHFTLVEANAKKAAFLRAAIRETGAHASVA